jgi:hypothetical protein
VAATGASTCDFVHAVGLRDIKNPIGRRGFAPRLMSRGADADGAPTFLQTHGFAVVDARARSGLADPGHDVGT